MFSICFVVGKPQFVMLQNFQQRNKHFKQFFELTSFSDMEAATSTLQHSYGLGPRSPNAPHGGQLAQGPHQSDQGPSGAPRPEQQPHHKPFFYIQPMQPCLPMQNMQWPAPMPMPVSYNPYYGYPGLGYSMPVMPHYQPNPYMEPPGFVVPHTHLHLTDYRRMLNPQYYQTMAYHARRFRYQHNAPAREMTSSEVQTEPLSGTQRTSTPGSSTVEASSVIPVHSSISDTPTSQLLSPALAMQKGDHSLELKDMVPSSTTRTPPNGSFVIQTEEVTIECCTTPVGLQVLHSHETAEVSHRFSKDVVQCSSIVQGHVLQDDGPCLLADRSEQSLQACPDILLVGTPSSGDKIPELEESSSQLDPVTVTSKLDSQVATHGEVEETRSEKDLSMISKNTHFKVIHLPFDPKYLEELQKMESTVWSMDETLIPSPESLIQNSLTEFYDETLAAVARVPSADALMLREEIPTEEIVPMIEMPPLAEDKLEDMVPTAEGPGDEMVSEADMCLVMDVPVEEETPEAEVTLATNLLLSNNPPLKADRNRHRQETHIQDHQDTSFESLPAYLPSTSWLADFDNVYYSSKMPPTPKKQSKPLGKFDLDVPTRRRKLDLEYKEQPTVRKPKERYKPKGKVDRRSLSDHECCLSKNFNENAFTPFASQRERLCSGCLTKRQICTSPSTGLDGRLLKRKTPPFQQWNDPRLPTCDACKSHSKKRLMRKHSSSDVRGPHHVHDTEGESSENSSCRNRSEWRVAEDTRRLNDLKRPLASKQNLEKYPAATYPKLREKNCVCNEPQHQPVVLERQHHCPHGNTIREMDENCTVPLSPQDKWRDQIYLTQRWQTGKSWKAVVPNPDGSKNEARSQHLNKHKTSQPQSQGTCRKDTRC
ncbi:bucky ball [Scomber scombrus]|uniref:Bucky ball n=2 Tax=Scomber scombrus TaxID=13677 RepID=A0AAV1PBT1_SCOSC